MARVLVIDDQEDIRNVLADILTEQGHMVRSVPDMRLGVEACTCEAFDVVLTDILMPGEKGYDVILELRSRFPDIKIIAMSGGGEAGPDGYLGLAQQLGAHAALAKPFGPEDLRDVVDRVLTA